MHLKKHSSKTRVTQLFRIVKLLLLKVLLPRHAWQKQVSRSIFLQFLVKISTFQQPATSPQMCLSPVFCPSVYRPLGKIPAKSASMGISATNALCFAGTFPGQFTKYRRVIGRQHWLRSVHKVPATSPSMWIRPNTARSFTSQLTKSRCVIGQQQHWLMIGWLLNKYCLILSVSVSLNKIHQAVNSQIWNVSAIWLLSRNSSKYQK